MIGLMLLLRVVHIACGVYWAGAILFVVTFLEPSVREVGPDGGKVMAAIQRRGYMTVMPVVALLTIISGLWLTWQVSAGFNRDWLMSPMGHTYLTGAVTAIAAAAVGILGLRRNVIRIGVLTASLGSAEEPAKEQIQREIQGRRMTVRTSGQVVGILLVIAVLTMAVARYVPAL